MPLLIALLFAIFGSARAAAQAGLDGGVPAPATSSDAGTLGWLPEPGTVVRWPTQAPVGACLGGSCMSAPSTLPPAAVPTLGLDRNEDRRVRFAYTGAVLGTVSAGLLLGSSIAIAQVDDLDSERYTRGAWLGVLAVSTPLVALSAHLARAGKGGAGSKAVRRIGWTAYTFAVTDAIVLWVGAFQGFGALDALTIGAGAFSVCALLPHALDALTAARSRRYGRSARLEPTLQGFRLRF